MQLTTIKQGNVILQICPQIGGSVARIAYNNIDILRPLLSENIASIGVRALGGYPLIPYSGRIKQARFIWQDKPCQLNRNFGQSPHSIHGNAWQQAWQIDDLQESRCVISLQYRPQQNGDWPFAYSAWQIFAIKDDFIHLHISMRNDEKYAAPAGIGWHPYFRKSGGLKIMTSTKDVWLNNDDHIPYKKIASPPQWQFNQLTDVRELELDNCFTSPNNKVNMLWQDNGLSVQMVSSDILNHLVIFTNRDKDFIAIEPASHCNNAINCGQMTVLEPSAILTADIKLYMQQDLQSS